MGRDFDHARFLAASERLAAFSLDELAEVPEDLDDRSAMTLILDICDGTAGNPALADPEVLRRTRLLAGAVVVAADDVTRMLHADLAELQEHVAVQNRDRFAVLWQLPQRFADRYDCDFLGQFVLAFADLADRLGCRPWAYPSCVAQRLGLDLILNRVELLIELADLDPTPRWRERLGDLFAEDRDHEFLYEPWPADQGVDDSVVDPTRLPGTGFEAWFTSHGPTQHPLPPALT